MIKSEYERAKRGLNMGDEVSLCIRGNYGERIERGILQKIENGYVYLDKGFAHHYTRIVAMSASEKNPSVNTERNGEK